MSTLVGTSHLLRLVLRLDRLRLTAWVLVLGGLPVVVGSSFATLYAAPASRQELVATVGSSPGLVALLGPVHGSSVGSLTSWRIGTIGAVLIGLMAAFTVIGHTREEEQTGRRDLLGATVVGRHAPLAAAWLVTTATGLAIGALCFAGLAGLGESIGGALAFGLGWTLTAVVFAAIGAVAAQLTQSAGGAKAVVGGVLGLSFMVRMAGDGGAASWMTWLSPIGWFSKLRPFGDEQWWVLTLFVAGAGLVGWLAHWLSGRRDVGAGVFQPRPGPARASASLQSEHGLAWRLQRPGLLGWTVGIALFATVWGGLGNTILDLVDENPQLGAIFEALGGSAVLTDAFFGVAMGVVALVVSAYGIVVALTPREEERALRADPVLATPTTRLDWVGSHLAYAALGPVLMMGFAGVAAGLAHGALVGDVGSQVVRLFELALLQVPAVWVVVAIAVALYGIVPGRASLAWGALVAFLLLGQLGQALELPQWALDLSPFTHVPNPPEPVTALPLVALTATSVALVVLGLAAFRRRDLA